MCTKANWTFGQQSRKALIQTVTSNPLQLIIFHICCLEYANPHTLLPKGRLLQLLGQAVEYQRDQCDFHSDSDSHGPFSLLRDHCCHNDCPLATKSVDFFKLQDMLTTMHGSINQVCFLDDGNKAVIGCEDGSLEVYDLSTKQCTTMASASEIRFMALKPDGQLFTIDEMGMIASWHTTEEELCKYTLRPAYQEGGITPRALAYACQPGLMKADVVIYAEDNGQVTFHDLTCREVVITYDWMIRDLVTEPNASGFCYVAKSNGIIEKMGFTADDCEYTVVWRIKIAASITSLTLSGNCKVLAVNTQKTVIRDN